MNTCVLNLNKGIILLAQKKIPTNVEYLIKNQFFIERKVCSNTLHVE